MNMSTMIAGLAGILLSGLLSGFVGYVVGRSHTLHVKKLEAMTKLYERVVEIEDMQLSDEKGYLLINIDKTSDKDDNSPMNTEELGYLITQSEWRRKMHGEERKARLWLSKETVDLVGQYFLLMMHCQHWQEFGKGNLLEDEHFLRYIGGVFGNTDDVLKDEEIIIGGVKPLFVNRVDLSKKCIEVIQKRMSLEVWLFPRLRVFLPKWLSPNCR